MRMPGPLLPFAYDQSRENESDIPLNLSQPRQRKRRTEDNDDDIQLEKNSNLYLDSIERPNLLAQTHSCNSLANSNKQGQGFFYSSLNSSSSALVDNENLQFYNNITNNTSSTILNCTHNNLNDNSADNLSSEASMNDFNSMLDVPSSPLLESQSGISNDKDLLRSDVFDDLISIDKNNNLNLKPAIPSSPTMCSQNSKSTSFPRPKFNKHIHPLSRHGSTFNEPTKKKQRILFQNPLESGKSKIYPTPPPQLTSKKIEFAIDRDGHVFGYSLEKDELPDNYSPTLYDEPIYFVVKNSSKQEQNLKRIIDEFFDQQLTSKSHVSILDLQDLNLNSLPDNITDIQDFYDCTTEGIIKPSIHIQASNNNLRSINPNLFKMERLQMLSLRNNKIARLSGDIDKAYFLKSLNLAMNKFKFLPHNILLLKKLEVLAISGNPMIQQTSVDKYFNVNEELLRLYSEKFKSTEFLDSNKQIKYFSRIHWLKSNSQISKSTVHVSLLSRSLTTLQDMCYDENGNLNDWTHTDLSDESNKLKLRMEEQNYIESKISMVPKLSELSLRKISQYLISESEVEKWKKSTNEFIYKRAMNSLIIGTNGETCGNCNENCVESVADMLEWWDFKGSRSVTIKRRFCSKLCALSWMKKLDNFKLIE